MSAKALHRQIKEHKEKVNGPHFLFSAENPAFPDRNEVGLTHNDVLNHLQGAGYDAHEISHYNGKSERGIIVYGVDGEKTEHLHNLAKRLGQDSSIHSDGENHEMRFHHGERAGKKFKGKGTQWHSTKPDSAHLSLPGGIHHFSHTFDYQEGNGG